MTTKKPGSNTPLIDFTREGHEAASGSNSLDFRKELVAQVMYTLSSPLQNTNEGFETMVMAAYEAMQAIAPRSELEGMLAAQMVATHSAAMDCLRRAATEGQTFAGRDMNLKHAVRLMGLYERQLAALDKHRGKGLQKITVEHVTVHAGGQATAGDVNAGEVARPSPAGGSFSRAAPPALADDGALGSNGESLRKALEAKAPARPTRDRK